MPTLALSVARLFDRVRTEEKGQGLIEYTLILGLITIIGIVVIGTIGTDIVAKMTQIAADI